MGMKETKKMLEIIEKQYRQANNEYNKELKRKAKLQKITNIALFIILIAVAILFVTVK